MYMTAWERLILDYANGRPLCNCRQAYETADGRCEHGCQAAQIDAKEHVAMGVLKELGKI